MQMRAELQEAFEEGRFYLKSIQILLLSHHPDCDYFDSDVIKFGQLKICKGCVIGYGLAILLLILFIIIRPFNDLIRESDPLVLASLGTFLTATQFLRILFPLNSQVVKTVQKIAFGIGIFLLAIALIVFDANILIKIVIFILFTILAGALLAVARPYYILKICRKCEWEQDWDRCPGFRELMNKVRKEDGRSRRGRRR